MLKYDFNKVTLIVTLERCWFGNTYIKCLKILLEKQKSCIQRRTGETFLVWGEEEGRGSEPEWPKKMLHQNMFMIHLTINNLPLISTVPILCKAVGTYWCTTNQRIQIPCK